MSVLTETTSGLGWHWDNEARILSLLLEVSGIAEDENGLPKMAGVKMAITGCRAGLTREKADASVATTVASGLSLGGKSFPVVPITWEDFKAKGYEE